MLPLWAKVDLGAMAMKGYSAFPIAPALLEPSPSEFLVSYPWHSLVGSYTSAEEQSVYFFSRCSIGKMVAISLRYFCIIYTLYVFPYTMWEYSNQKKKKLKQRVFISQKGIIYEIVCLNRIRQRCRNVLTFSRQTCQTCWVNKYFS